MTEAGQGQVFTCPSCCVPMERVWTMPFVRPVSPNYTRRPEPTEKALLKAWETGQV